MQTPDTDGPVEPVLIFDRTGALAGSAMTNGKGFNKSLENGLLWALDGKTGRLVPLTDLAQGIGVRIGSALTAAGRGPGGRWLTALDRVDGAIVARSDLDLGLSFGNMVEAAAMTKPPALAGAASVGLPVADANAKELTGFILELQELIRGRKASLPEGSYTTHLFKAGLGKIRKKTGEEAIELLLAQTPEETVSEASDLVYHLMVLLVALDIPVERVLTELKRR